MTKRNRDFIRRILSEPQEEPASGHWLTSGRIEGRMKEKPPIMFDF